MNKTEVQKILKETEGIRLNAYQDTGGIWTIGIGATFYENGKKVQSTDKITLQRAYELFHFHLQYFENGVKKLVTSKINDNQLSALTMFAFNVGLGQFKASTLLKLVNNNPNDELIKKEFPKWNKDNGKVLGGLVTKRKLELQLYFKPISFLQNLIKPAVIIPVALFFYSVITITI